MGKSTIIVLLVCAIIYVLAYKALTALLGFQPVAAVAIIGVTSLIGAGLMLLGISKTSE